MLMQPTNPTPEQPAVQPETQHPPETAEFQPSQAENQPSGPSNAPPPLPPSNSSTNTITTQSTATPPPTQVPATNLPAADGDLIEKHWVDRAEQIITSDKDDPQKEEADEENLSNQYLKQRFNYDVDKSE